MCGRPILERWLRGLLKLRRRHLRSEHRGDGLQRQLPSGVDISRRKCKQRFLFELCGWVFLNGGINLRELRCGHLRSEHRGDCVQRQLPSGVNFGLSECQ